MTTEHGADYTTTDAGHLNYVTGFRHDPSDEETVLVYILPGYTGLQKCNYSEVMMHMNRTDKTMAFRLNGPDRYHSVQLLNPDGSNWSGSVTTGEGGVYREGRGDDRHYYYLPIKDMTEEYVATMSGIDQFYCDMPISPDNEKYCRTEEGKIRYQYTAEQAAIDKLATKYMLHPTVLHDICEAVTRTDWAMSDQSDEAQEAAQQVRQWAGQTESDPHHLAEMSPSERRGDLPTRSDLIDMGFDESELRPEDHTNDCECDLCDAELTMRVACGDSCTDAGYEPAHSDERPMTDGVAD